MMDETQLRYQEPNSQQTKKIIEEMLEFLNSSSEEEDDSHDDETAAVIKKDVEQSDEEEYTDNLPLKKSAGKLSYNCQSFVAEELRKIEAQFPVWEIKEDACNGKKPNSSDPIWQQKQEQQQYTTSLDVVEEELQSEIDCQNGEGDGFVGGDQNEWNSKLESNCRRNSNTYVQEVNRAIYGDTTGHPLEGSAEYFQAAQNYAIYGKDFFDFPQNLTPLLGDKAGAAGGQAAPTEPVSVTLDNYGNHLYQPHAATSPTPSGGGELTAGIMGFANFGKQCVTSAASTTSAAAAYYQMCNGMQTPMRAATSAGTATYGMFLGHNKVTYVAGAPPSAPPMVYNQQQPQHSTASATNFISNSLANAALASTPTVLYSNPMLTTTTQQYLNTFLKETQYLSCGSTPQGTAVSATTTSIYERLIYAQMLQQQIYHQSQQQAAAVAAIFQHKAAAAAARPPSRGGVAMPTSVTVMPVQTTSLNQCGHQAVLVTSSAAAAGDLMDNQSTPLSTASLAPSCSSEVSNLAAPAE